jgi:hypothetical protein
MPACRPALGAVGDWPVRMRPSLVDGRSVMHLLIYTNGDASHVVGRKGALGIAAKEAAKQEDQQHDRDAPDERPSASHGCEISTH